jgi:MFS family permease
VGTRSFQGSDASGPYRRVRSSRLCASRKTYDVAAGGFCLVTSQANPAGPVFGFAMIGLGAANVVPLIFSLASESGGALGNNISYTAMLGYLGVLTGPAVIGFFAHSRGFGVAFSGVACLLTLVAISGLIAVLDRRP